MPGIKKSTLSFCSISKACFISLDVSLMIHLCKPTKSLEIMKAEESATEASIAGP